MSLDEFIRQWSILLSSPVVVLMGVAATVIVVARDWRLVLFSYAVESVTVAFLLMQHMPMEWALLQVIVGGLVAVMLFLSARQLQGGRGRYGYGGWTSRESRWPQLASLGLLRLLTVCLALLAFYAVHDKIQMPQVNSIFRDGILWLAMIGGVGLALHEEPLHAGLSLLTGIAGFLLLFFGMTQNRLMIGVLQGWQLLLGLAIAYLTVSRGLAATEAPPDPSPFRWRP